MPSREVGARLRAKSVRWRRRSGFPPPWGRCARAKNDASDQFARATVLVQNKEPESSGAGDTAPCKEESQSGAEGPAVASSNDALSFRCSKGNPLSAHRCDTSTAGGYGRWVTLRHEPSGSFRNAPFSISLSGLRRYSTSVARFPDGTISVQTIKSKALHHLDQDYTHEPIVPGSFGRCQQQSWPSGPQLPWRRNDWQTRASKSASATRRL